MEGKMNGMNDMNYVNFLEEEEYMSMNTAFDMYLREDVNSWVIGVPHDPQRWSNKNVQAVIKLRTFTLDKTNNKRFWMLNGSQLITMKRDSLLYDYGLFGMVLCEILTILEKKYIEFRIEAKRDRYFTDSKMYVWQFMLDLLVDGNHEDVIAWNCDIDGGLEFRIRSPEKLASMWGARKKHHNMDYKKISREIRYHSDKKRAVICRPTSRLLFYKFINLKEIFIKYSRKSDRFRNWCKLFRNKVAQMSNKTKKQTLINF
jgi:hypothetical protein